MGKSNPESSSSQKIEKKAFPDIATKYVLVVREFNHEKEQIEDSRYPCETEEALLSMYDSFHEQGCVVNMFKNTQRKKEFRKIVKGPNGGRYPCFSPEAVEKMKQYFKDGIEDVFN